MNDRELLDKMLVPGRLAAALGHLHGISMCCEEAPDEDPAQLYLGRTTAHHIDAVTGELHRLRTLTRETLAEMDAERDGAAESVGKLPQIVAASRAEAAAYRPDMHADPLVVQATLQHFKILESWHILSLRACAKIATLTADLKQARDLAAVHESNARAMLDKIEGSEGNAPTPPDALREGWGLDEDGDPMHTASGEWVASDFYGKWTTKTEYWESNYPTRDAAMDAVEQRWADRDTPFRPDDAAQADAELESGR
jgi:hypothetical protein